MTATVRAGESRRIETPNATMTTLASPSLGPSEGLSLWSVEMEVGATGPLHAFDREQIWTVLDGEVAITVAGEAINLKPGDTIVFPAAAERQVHARSAARLVVCGAGDAVATVSGEEAPRGTPAWIA